MKTLLYILNLLLLPLFCFSQYNSKQTDWQKDNLVGNVKQVITDNCKTPKVDTSRNTVRMVGFSFSCQLIDVYNKNGNKIDVSRYYNDGSLNDKLINKYDNLNRLVEHKQCNSNCDNPFVTIYKYSIDKTVKMYRSESIDKPTLRLRTIFKYDDKDNLIEEDGLRHDSSLLMRKIYKYNDKGKLIEQKNCELRDTTKIIFKYDDVGNKIESDYLYANGFVEDKETWKYDDRKNVIEHCNYGYDGTLKFKYTDAYEYDKMGNWVKRTECINNGKCTITTRKIEYY